MNAPLGREDLKQKLQQMDNYEFEHFVADLWERQGWATEVEQQSGDAGIDVRAIKSSPYRQKQLIQAKRYAGSTKVGGPDIQQYASLKHQEEGVDAAVIVTTSSFTKSAKSRAQDLNVKLVDGDDLVSLINNLEAYDLVENYTTLGSSASEPDLQGGVGSQTPSNDSSEKIQVLDIPILEFEYEKGSTPVDVDTTKTKWYYAIWGGIAAWILTLFVPGQSLSTFFLILGWILLPLGIIADLWKVGGLSPNDGGWWIAVLGSLVPILGIISTAFYLIHRRGMTLDLAQR